MPFAGKLPSEVSIRSAVALLLPPAHLAMHNRPIPLGQLRTGQTARISRIHGLPDHVHRLEEFGLRGGICIEMFRPGNPCIIRIAGSKICFRAEDGLSISVVPVPRGD